MKKICTECSKEFRISLSDAKRGRGKFCSQICSKKYQTKKPENNPNYKGGKLKVVCLNCKTDMEVYASVIKQGDGKVCSKKCKHELMSKTQNGENNPNWGGGRTKEKRGYVQVKGGFKRLRGAAYVREHRLIMERHLGRQLETDEHVHHINGDKSDNRIENLLLMTSQEHSRLHCTERNQRRNAQSR